jgi:hypothetical protein
VAAAVWKRLNATPGSVWIAVVVAWYLSLFIRVQWRIGDEGDMLNGAVAVAEGRVPYRDFFDLRGPACFYWLGLFFKTFGATWLVARVHLLLTGTLISVLVYDMARSVCRRSEAILITAMVTALSIPAWPAAHHHWDSNLFALAAARAFFAWQPRGRTRWLFVSGVLAGLTSSFIYQKGFYLLLSFLAVMVMSRLYFRAPIRLLKCTGILLAGYGAVGMAVLAWFYYLGALQAFIDSTISVPLHTYADANRLQYAHHLVAYIASAMAPWRSLSMQVAVPAATISAIPVLLITALPVLVLCLVCVCAAGRARVRWVHPPVVSYGLTGVALWLSEFHRPDTMHLIYGCPILLIALVLLWDRVELPNPARAFVTAAVAVPLLILATTQAVGAAAADNVVLTRRGKIVMPREDLALKFLLSDQVSRGDYVFVYPYYSAYYFLADVRNPTRFGEMMYGPGSKPFFDEAIRGIESRRVKYILWDTVVEGQNLKEWFPAYNHPPRHDQWMELYFEEHYEQVAVLNGFRLLKRKTGLQSETALATH